MMANKTQKKTGTKTLETTYSSLLAEIKRIEEESKRLVTESKEKEERFRELSERAEKVGEQLAVAKLKETGRTWCTNCQAIIDSGDKTFVLIEGTRLCGEDDQYIKVPFSEFHRMCPKCRGEALNQHGSGDFCAFEASSGNPPAVTVFKHGGRGPFLMSGRDIKRLKTPPPNLLQLLLSAREIPSA